MQQVEVFKQEIEHKNLARGRWQLIRVIAGHTGWVRCLAMDPLNAWVASGSADRTIKIWDTATGELKLTLTGHIGAVKGLSTSKTQPYIFSAGEDKQIKCWDLECNKAIRHFFGHLSGVTCITSFPELPSVIATGSRDCSVRLWDLRSRQTIHVLTGHHNAVTSLLACPTKPHLVSGSASGENASGGGGLRMWDLVAGKTCLELTHHKRSVRALASHPLECTFLSAGADSSIKRWKHPEGIFLHNYELPHIVGSRRMTDRLGETSQSNQNIDQIMANSIVNALAVNEDGYLMVGCDDGKLHVYNHSDASIIQTLEVPPQPGSLASEASILAATFDRSGYRLFTGEGDKSIKVWGMLEE